MKNVAENVIEVAGGGEETPSRERKPVERGMGTVSEVMAGSEGNIQCFWVLAQDM